jgi:hypothetical protein
MTIAYEALFDASPIIKAADSIEIDLFWFMSVDNVIASMRNSHSQTNQFTH